VCTGDIEDAPGLDSLWKYTAEVRDGKIFVTAPEKEVKAKVGRVIARPRAPLAATLKEKVVIVGGGSGGIHTIESLREHNFAGDIVLISQEDYAPIDRYENCKHYWVADARTKLSKALQDDPTKVEWRKPAELKDDFGVELHLATTVSAIDTAAQTVTIPSGQIKYDHLVLSPGATPRRIPIPGADLPGVVTIRTPHDVKKVTEALGPNTDIIVIGTSFIGLEATGALTKKEKKSLTVVGVDPVPFEAMLGRDLGKAIQKSYEDQGVTFHMDTQIEKITAGPDGKAAQLHIKGKDPLPASLVIMGTGVAPATSFLKDSSSFTLERDGGITVDEYLRVPGAKNVYAIGDIAHYPQFPDGNPRRVEHWNVAGNHGRHVAATIAGTPKPYKGVPIFWSSIGKGLRYVGTGAGFDDTYLDGSITDLKFVLYQAKGGKITAVASMGRDPYVSKSSELLKLGKMPTLDEIKVGKVSNWGGQG